MSRLPRSVVSVAPMLGILLLACLLLARVGVIPASSSGDDVFHSDAAYWLHTDGVLRRDINQDAIGSAKRDFFPPTPSLMQFIAFSSLGINQFSMAIAPTLATLLMIIINFVYAQKISRNSLIAAAYSISFLIIPEAVRYTLQVRFDVYVAFFLNIALIAGHHLVITEPAPSQRNSYVLLISGLCLACAVISYYQFAPVAVATGLLTLAVDRAARSLWQSGLLLIAGAALPVGAFMWWIGDDLLFFLNQNLKAAGGYGLAGRIAASFAEIGIQQLVCISIAVASATLALVFGKSGRRIDTERTWLIGLPCITIISSYLSAIAFTGMLLSSAVLAAHCALASRVRLARSRGVDLEKGSRHPRMRPADVAGPDNFMATNLRAATIFQTVVLLGMGGTGAVLTGGYSILGLTGPGRHYSKFGAQIVQNSNLDGIVLFDNPAWLALRQKVPRGRLIQLEGLAPTAGALTRSLILDDCSAAAKVSTVIMRPPLEELDRQRFPIVGCFIERPGVKGPIYVGNALPYKVAIYRTGK